MDVKLQAELEDNFKKFFLQTAPLYRAAGKIKLPFEDIKRSTTLYRGSLSEQTRPVLEIADYHIFKDGYPGDDAIRAHFNAFGMEAAYAVENLIRIENGQHDPDHDVRSPHIKVTDIFEHADGRRNLQIMFATSPSVVDPARLWGCWIAYRFHFAAANVRTEYRPA